MKKHLVVAGLTVAVTLSTAAAMAESIKGKFGVTAKIGFVSPSDSDIQDSRVKADIGFIMGGNVLYGIDDNFTAEIDITHSWFGSDFPRSGNAGDFGVTNLSFGGQYRFIVANPKLTPYVGTGLDILFNDHDQYDIDTTVGVHVSGGIDYFILRQLALNAEIKGVLAPETDIRNAAGKQGNFDPSSVSTTFGVRYFF